MITQNFYDDDRPIGGNRSRQTSEYVLFVPFNIDLDEIDIRDAEFRSQAVARANMCQEIGLMLQNREGRAAAVDLVDQKRKLSLPVREAQIQDRDPIVGRQQI